MPQNHLTFVEFLKDNTQVNINGVTQTIELDAAHGVMISPDGNYVYVTAGGNDDAVTVFSRDAQTGKLTFIESIRDNATGSGGRLNGASGIAMSPDGTSVYIASIDEDAISVFSRNPQNGKLTFVEAIVNSTDLDAVSGIAVSSDGSFVYAAAGGNSDAITVFSRNSSDGKLTLIESLKNDTNGITNFDGASRLVLSPDSNHVYVTATNSNAIAVFHVVTMANLPLSSH